MSSSWTEQDPIVRQLREELVSLMPMIAEVNAICEELGKDMNFEIIVQSGSSHDLNDKSKSV